MKNDNKGLSLVELIVAFGVLAVISAMLVGFMTSGARMYRSVSSEVGMQVGAQVAMAQVQEYIIDCNGGLCFDGGKLYVLNSDASGYTAHVFAFDATTGQMYYGKNDVSFGAGGAPQCDEDTPHLLATGVSTFDVSFAQTVAGNARLADLNAGFATGGKSYSGVQTIAPRNMPAVRSSFAVLLQDVAVQGT